MKEDREKISLGETNERVFLLYDAEIYETEEEEEEEEKQEEKQEEKTNAEIVFETEISETEVGLMFESVVETSPKSSHPLELMRIGVPYVMVFCPRAMSKGVVWEKS